MKTANLAAQSIRQSESGLVWEEKITGGSGTIKVLPHATFRVSSITGSATTVTIDGVLAMTMSINGEIAIFNAGAGNPDDTDPLVTIVIAGGTANVQVARDTDRKKILT